MGDWSMTLTAVSSVTVGHSITHLFKIRLVRYTVFFTIWTFNPTNWTILPATPPVTRAASCAFEATVAPLK